MRLRAIAELWGQTAARVRPSVADVRKVGEALGVDWGEIPLREFQKGIWIEMEHGSRDPQTDVTHNNLLATAKIALAHLKERADYYTELAKVENA